MLNPSWGGFEIHLDSQFLHGLYPLSLMYTICDSFLISYMKLKKKVCD